MNKAPGLHTIPTKETHLGCVAESQAKNTCIKYQKNICNYVCRRCTIPRSHYAERTIKVESGKGKTFFKKHIYFHVFIHFYQIGVFEMTFRHTCTHKHTLHTSWGPLDRFLYPGTTTVPQSHHHPSQSDRFLMITPGDIILFSIQTFPTNVVTALMETCVGEGRGSGSFM